MRGKCLLHSNHVLESGPSLLRIGLFPWKPYGLSKLIAVTVKPNLVLSLPLEGSIAIRHLHTDECSILREL